MPGADKFVFLALEWTAEMETDVGNGTRSAIDLVDQYRASKKVNSLRSFFRDFIDRAKWSLRYDEVA